MPSFLELLRGHIIGIIDFQGAIHSEFTGERVACHEEFWTQGQVKWRWNHNQSIWWITRECKPDDEQFDVIMRHLTKKFGLQWYENGHHDIPHLLSRAHPLIEGDHLQSADENGPDTIFHVAKTNANYVWLLASNRQRARKYRREDNFIQGLIKK